KLPKDALAPSITRSDPDSAPVLIVAVSGSRDPKEITEIADKKVLQVLETVNGVGGITLQGDRRRQIQLLLDADRLTAYGLTADQVRNAIERQNVEIPGGAFIAGPSEISLRTMGRLVNVADFNRIILSQANGSVITLADVGKVLDSVQEIRSVSKLDG